MAIQIKFVTTLDLINLGREKIRVGAVGVWDLNTHRIAFRRCDVIDFPYGDNLAVYEEDAILLFDVNRKLIQIEDAM